mgnify:CR=1 FL=1
MMQQHIGPPPFPSLRVRENIIDPYIANLFPSEGEFEKIGEHLDGGVDGKSDGDLEALVFVGSHRHFSLIVWC